MGGYGSGRQGWRTKVEHCRSLDVNRLRKAGCLEPGTIGIWEWKEDGERVASIGLRGEEHAIRLVYRWSGWDEDWQDIDYRVPIVRKACNFGGERPYFLCQGVVNGRYCGRRAVKLFGAGRYYLCRHCYGLSYASQSEFAHDRALRRANKRRMRLGGYPGTEELIERPKGMWRRTFEREVEAIYADEELADRLFFCRIASLLGRLDPSLLED